MYEVVDCSYAAVWSGPGMLAVGPTSIYAQAAAHCYVLL